MKVIVTGATGFVGSHIVRHYADLGHEVIAMGRQKNPPTLLLKYATWLQLDLKDEKYPSLDADLLVHAAAMASDRGSYQSFYDNNVNPTIKLYKRFTGKHFVFISSSSVYPFIGKPLKEEDGIIKDALSSYGRTKLEAENALIKIHSPNCKLTILRPRSIYGTNDRVLLPRILKLYKKKILLLGTMDVEVSMTHISNLILAIEAASENQLDDLGVFNVADNQIYNLRTIITSLITKLAGKRLKTLSLPLYFIRCLTKLTTAFKIPFPLTRQSFDYLSKSCLLDTTRIKEDLDVDFKTHFDLEIDAIHEWISKVGLSKVRSADPDLPWLGL